MVVPFHNSAPDITGVVVGDAAGDGTRIITVTATDPDGDKPTVTIAGVDSGNLDPPAVASAGNAVTATFVYRPDASYAASHPGQLDGFTVTATDPYGLTDTDATGDISIPSPPQNQKPVITSTSATTPDANGKVTISANATDDGDIVILTITGGTGQYGLSSSLFVINSTGTSSSASTTPRRPRGALKPPRPLCRSTTPSP